MVLVVSRSWSGLESLSLATLRKLYLGKRTQLAGHRVHPVDLRSGSRVRRAFIRAVLGRSEAELEEYWIEQALAGGPLPPRELASPADVMRAVGKEPGTIGYVDQAAYVRGAPPSVRVLPLEVDGEPLASTDPRYPIRVPEP